MSFYEALTTDRPQESNAINFWIFKPVVSWRKSWGVSALSHFERVKKKDGHKEHHYYVRNNTRPETCKKYKIVEMSNKRTKRIL